MDSPLWRLILDPPSDGARNMAVDEALLEETAAGSSLPTLRLYAWEPPTLSLGFAQPLADCNREALQRLGWGLVRRPTGGRAILHTDELTYSVTAPESHPLMQGGVLESYRRLSLGLLAGLRLLGVEGQSETGQRTRNAGNPVCFEIPSQYEISAGGRKLIGSAQARRPGGVLQHGAFPLRGDLARILQALAGPQIPPERIRRRAATLDDLLGRKVSWQEAADAVTRGFAETFEIDFRQEELTEKEKTRAGDLARGKYGTDEWTSRV
ncbi:MAG: biotin/lipoate A/B protein ligase family protein [Anaerolineales bacterium]